GPDLKGGTCTSATVHQGKVAVGARKHQGTPALQAAPTARPRPVQSSGSSGIGNTDDPNDSCNALRPCDIHVIDPHKPGKGGVITIADLKNFAPHPGIDRMEPNGWAVIGLDTNFYSTIGSELEHDQLLGKTADVRFTPVGWHWSYGDGGSASLATPGASWAATGSQDFDPTPTSHVYLKAGSYTIQLYITFSAQYRYAGGSWKDVIGTIGLSTNPLAITAGSARTVLVNHDCQQGPSGPGC
ncbi:MAG: hypothetical protein QOI14_1158, partial [Actinomycetota bacterium]|nr:hypothetical protein [Actinomycetota bacterium]